MSTENIIIEEKDLETVKEVCNWISDDDQRKYIAAKILGIAAANKYFAKIGIEADIQSGLHNVTKVTEDCDINDIYINGSYIDVRVCTKGALSVPRMHFDSNILPSAYMFVDISKNLDNAEVLGFILPQGVNVSEDMSDDYSINDELLLNFDDVKDYIESSEGNQDIQDSEIYAYLENSINDRISFYRYLLTSTSARQKLIKAEKAQKIFNFVSIQPEEAVSEQAFEYSTVATPSLPEYENIIDNSDSNNEEEFVGEQIVENVAGDDADYEQDGKAIAELFKKNQQQQESETYSDDGFDINSVRKEQSKKSPVLLIAFIIIAVIGAGCYFFFTKSGAGLVEDDSSTAIVADSDQNIESANNVDAMPLESIEAQNGNKLSNQNEGNAIAIPAIERNLDASILVSNLKVDWEVPVGYASSTAAKRYLMKLGKVIQLNLKSELLLLSKPPLSNRIAVEIKYNSGAKSYEVVGITASSGEKTVDDVVLQVINKALKMKFNTSIDSFGKIAGNPVLVIKL